MSFDVFKAFVRTEDGNFAMIAALTALPLIVALGGAVDYARAVRAGSVVQDTLDSAALAAAKELETGTKEDAEEIATMFVAAQLPETLSHIPLEIAIDEQERRVRLSMNGGVPTAFLPLIQIDTLPVVRSSTAAGARAAFIDIYLLLDVSESMNLAADEYERSRFNTKMESLIGDQIYEFYKNTGWYNRQHYESMGGIRNCSFACHLREGWEPQGMTAYKMARNWGIKLRIDTLQEAVDGFIEEILDPNSEWAEGKTIRIATAGFSTHYIPRSEPSSDIDALQASIRDFEITTDNAKDYSYADRALEGLKGDLGTQGSGMTADDPYKMAILVTDGMRDENNVTNLGPIDVHDCNAVKDLGIPLSVLEIKYIADWDHYMFRNHFSNGSLTPPPRGGTFGKVSPALEECASPEFFFTAQDSGEEELDSAFADIIAGLRSSRLKLVY